MNNVTSSLQELAAAMAAANRLVSKRPVFGSPEYKAAKHAHRAFWAAYDAASPEERAVITPAQLGLK